jgi:hypothetical protein
MNKSKVKNSRLFNVDVRKRLLLHFPQVYITKAYFASAVSFTANSLGESSIHIILACSDLICSFTILRSILRDNLRHFETFYSFAALLKVTVSRNVCVVLLSSPLNIYFGCPAYYLYISSAIFVLEVIKLFLCTSIKLICPDFWLETFMFSGSNPIGVKN